MKLTENERNLIRCSVSLSVPVILDYISTHDNDINAIRHMLPFYTLLGASPDISPYFTPACLKDTGKRRVYVNSNGYRILYITLKMLYRFTESATRFYVKHDVENIFRRIASRWVIMKGSIPDYQNNFERFVNSLVVAEIKPSRDNHPPVGDNMFAYPDLTYGVSTTLQPKPVLDLMTHPEIKLEKYKLNTSLLKETENVHDV